MELNAFDQWMMINREASKRDLQLLNFALLRLKKHNLVAMNEEGFKVSFKPSEFSQKSRKVSCDYVSISRSVKEINRLIKLTNIKFLHSCTYNDKDKICEFHFNKDALFFTRSRQNRLISSRRLQDSLYLRTVMAIRLFNYLSKWRYVTKTAFIPIAELRENLGVEDDSYLRFERFRVCVIDQCINEINHFTKHKISYELKHSGVGGKVQAIRFYTESKTL